MIDILLFTIHFQATFAGDDMVARHAMGRAPAAAPNALTEAMLNFCRHQSSKPPYGLS